MKWTKTPPSVPGLYLLWVPPESGELVRVGPSAEDGGELYAEPCGNYEWHGRLVGKSDPLWWWSDESLPEFPGEEAAPR